MSQSSRLRSRCPHCRRWVVGGAMHLSKQVICPGCKREFRFAVQRTASPVGADLPQPAASTHVDFRNQEIPPHVLELIPLAMARTNNILPLEIDQETVVIAAPDALAFDLQQQLEFMLGRQVRLMEAPAAEIALAVERFYATAEKEEPSPSGAAGVISQPSQADASTEAEDNAPSAVKETIEVAFESAMRQHATRIIFSHRPDKPLEIHYQLPDGERIEAPPTPQHMADRILNYLKANIGRDGDAVLEMHGTRSVLKADRHHDAEGDQIVIHIGRLNS